MPVIKGDFAKLLSYIKFLNENLHTKQEDMKLNKFDRDSVKIYAREKGIDLDKFDDLLLKSHDFIENLYPKKIV
jgi:hypothetical protein